MQTALDLFTLLRLFCTGLFSRIGPVCKKICLPTRHRKGNLLTTLSFFYTAIFEQLKECRSLFQDTFHLPKMPFPYQDNAKRLLQPCCKAIRTSLVLVSWVLVLLALVEWTPVSASPVSAFASGGASFIRDDLAGSETALVKVAVCEAQSALQFSDPVSSLRAVSQLNAYSVYSPVSSKRWLRLRILRI